MAGEHAELLSNAFQCCGACPLRSRFGIASRRRWRIEQERRTCLSRASSRTRPLFPHRRRLATKRGTRFPSPVRKPIQAEEG
jgi:hypothetical protein